MYFNIFFLLRILIYVSLFRWTPSVKQQSVWFSLTQRQWMTSRRNALSWTLPGAVWWDVLISAKTSLETPMTCSASSLTLGEGRAACDACWSDLLAWCTGLKTRCFFPSSFVHRDLMSWINGIRGLVSSEELAKDVTGAEALLERHQVPDSSILFLFKSTNISAGF